MIQAPSAPAAFAAAGALRLPSLLLQAQNVVRRGTDDPRGEVKKRTEKLMTEKSGAER
jgi:hypothetical protein